MSSENELEDGAAEGAQKPKGRGKVLLIIGLLGGLLLGAAGMFYGYGMFDGEEVETKEEEVPHEVEPVEIFTVQIRRINVPLIDAEKRLLGYMWIDAQFEVIGSEAQSELSRREGRVRDNLIRTLHNRQTTRTDRPGALDFDLITQILEDAAKQVLAPGALNRVNLSNAQAAPR